MCFVNEPEPIQPTPPPEVLKQAAPDKKTAAQPSRSQNLSIGTKKYRNESGIGTAGLGKPKAPSGISV